MAVVDHCLQARFTTRLVFALLLWSSPFQTIQLARTLLCFTGLTTSNFAYVGSEQCQGKHLVAVRAFEHYHIILSSFDYVKRRSLNLSHSQSLQGYFWVGSAGKTHLILAGSLETKTPFTRSPVPFRDLRILSVYHPPMGTPAAKKN